MNPTTAVLFILSGISLGLSLRRTSAFRFWTGQATAFVVLALAAAKLLQLAAHWPLTVDQWLFAEKLGPTATEGANRMAPNTAAEFALLALAILLLDRRMRKFSPTKTLALLAGFGALLPITGYLYGVRSFEIVNSALLGRLFSKLHAPEESLKIEKAFTTAKMGLTAEIFAAKCQKSDRSCVQLHWSIQWSPHHQRMFCVGRAG
jgi:hypothetical protein